jgi:hypothetical protein
VQDCQYCAGPPSVGVLGAVVQSFVPDVHARVSRAQVVVLEALVAAGRHIGRSEDLAGLGAAVVVTVYGAIDSRRCGPC